MGASRAIGRNRASIQCRFRALRRQIQQRRIVVVDAGKSQDFFRCDPLAAARRSHGDAFTLELPQIVQRLSRAVEYPIDLIVDASQRQQIWRTIAVRNAALRDTDLDSRRRVVQQLDVIPCAVRQTQLHTDTGACKDALIPRSDGLVGLIFCACGDCEF